MEVLMSCITFILFIEILLTWMLVNRVSTEDRLSAKMNGPGNPGGNACPGGSWILSSGDLIIGIWTATSSAKNKMSIRRFMRRQIKMLAVFHSPLMASLKVLFLKRSGKNLIRSQFYAPAPSNLKRRMFQKKISKNKATFTAKKSSNLKKQM